MFTAATEGPFALEKWEERISCPLVTVTQSNYSLLCEHHIMSTFDLLYRMTFSAISIKIIIKYICV